LIVNQLRAGYSKQRVIGPANVSWLCLLFDSY